MIPKGLNSLNSSTRPTAQVQRADEQANEISEWKNSSTLHYHKLPGGEVSPKQTEAHVEVASKLVTVLEDLMLG